MSSLRRFARPATMPGDAISCNTGWPWGGARAPPVGPRSSRGGHGLLFGWANRRWTHPLRMAVTPRTQRIAAPNNSESYSRRHPNLHEAGPNGRRRRRPCPLDCGKERSSLLSPSLTSGHGTRNIPAWVMCSCGRRALLPARGYWSLGNFLRRSLVRGVGVSPSASCGCRTRISARGREAPLRPRCKRLTGQPICQRPAGGQKCIALFGFAPLGTRGPQPGGLDRDSRRRPMPLIILGRRRLRLDMTTQGVASRVTTTIRVGDGTLRQ